MTADQVRILFDKWLQDTISADEKSALMAALREAEGDVLDDLVTRTFDVSPIQFEQDASKVTAIYQHVINQTATEEEPARVFSMRIRWLRYVAVFILVAGMGVYSWMRLFPESSVAKVKTALPADIAPGHDGAVLTLADGRKLVLDSLGNGVVASEQGTSLLLADGKLAYDAIHAEGVGYNTVSTPKGRQFQLVLPDGSQVWLNAASSLRYPTAFKGAERKVEVTGEAYFIIAANKAMPFKVAVNGTEINVLGTQFNVNAYADEPIIKTTLEQGKVSLSVGDNSVLLKPGQQAQVEFASAGSMPANRQIRLLKDNIHVDEVVAWKKGFFYLNSDDIPAVMRQIARWYDLEVVFKNGIPQGHLSGRAERSLYLSQMLKVLELSGVHVQLEGSKLVVLP